MMLRTFAVLALSSTALSAVACKGKQSSAPGGCETGYVMTQGNVCVMQNIVDYNQCVESAAARESINVGLTKEILGRLQLVWVEPGIGPTPEARAKAAKFIELNPGSCRELEVVWGCYQVANKVSEDASATPICQKDAAAGAPAGTGTDAGAAGAGTTPSTAPGAGTTPSTAPAPK